MGCAFYSDLLSSYATFSKTMQLDHLDVLGALLSLLQTVNEVRKLSSKPLTQWPTYAMVLKNIKNEGGQNIYQCQTLKKLDEANEHFSSQCTHLCSVVTTCLKARLEWSSLEISHDIVRVLPRIICMDRGQWYLLAITKTSKWEVVKNSASPKRPFFPFFFLTSWPQISLFHKKSLDK